MPFSKISRFASTLTVSVLVFSFSPTTSLAKPAADIQPVLGGPCAEKLLQKPAPLSKVLTQGQGLITAAAVSSGLSVAELKHEAKTDNSLWLDSCGKVFYVEKAVTQPVAAEPATSKALPAPLSQTFNLNSKPDSSKTIYLDFLGGTVTGTAWNADLGPTITYAPYSITEPMDTNFTDAELTQIQRVWQTVSEDYAPFDVNVTTQNPGAGAIDRTNLADQNFGTRVVITSQTAQASTCGCGGIAYMDVFDMPGSDHQYYQPAWVFTQGVTTNGKPIGDAASHEAGHNFGLDHDGQGASSYYGGSAPWAPIMGSSYNQPVAQWSKGEYALATKTEDDLAIIAQGAPVRTDEAGTRLLPAPLTNNQASGVISSASDEDVYAFAANGDTTVSVNVADFANLDSRLLVLNSQNQTVADVNPTSSRTSFDVASGMGASWQGNLPQGTYRAIVLGGAGSNYGNYGSVGNYTLSVLSQSTPEPTSPELTLTFTSSAQLGQSYTSTLGQATGGTSPYTYQVTGLPAGLQYNSATNTIQGTPTSAGTFNVSATVTDSAGKQDTKARQLVVQGTSTQAASAAFRVYQQGQVNYQLQATGGTGSYTWQASGVPSGLTVSASGLIEGAVPSAGTYSFAATATSGGTSSTSTVTIDVFSDGVFANPASYQEKTNTQISLQLQATGGTGQYTWSSQQVPQGFTLSSSGLLTGKTATAGTYEFTATATSGAVGASDSTSSAKVTLIFTSEPPLTFTGTSLTLKAGETLQQQLVSSGGNSSQIQWSTTNAPSWVNLSPSGLLTLTPSQAGTYTFNATVADEDEMATAPVAVTVQENLPILESNDVGVSLKVGSSFTRQLLATGGTGQYEWGLAQGSSLPSGITLSKSGVLSGTPTTAGSYTALVKVTSGDQSDTSMLSVTVEQANLKIKGNKKLPNAKKGQLYQVTASADNLTSNQSSVTWTRKGALPKGLSGSSFTRGGTYVISGKPTQTGTWEFVLIATDETGRKARKTFTLTVRR